MSNKAGYALLGAAVVVLGAVVWSKRTPSAPPVPPLPALPVIGPGWLDANAAELESLRPEADSDGDPAVAALLARAGRLGALGADDLAEARELADGVAAALPSLLDLIGSPPPGDAPRPDHAAVPPEQRLRRADAATLLGAIGDSRAIPALGAFLDSPNADPYVQEAAAEALGAIGDRAALVPLLSFLAEDRLKDWRVTIAAGAAALRLGAPMGGDELMTVISDWNPAMAKRPRVFDRERVVKMVLQPLAGREVAPYDPYMLPPQLKKAGAKWVAWWSEYRPSLAVPPEVRSSEQLTGALLQAHLPYFDGQSFFYRKRAQDVLAGLGAEGLPYLLHLLRHDDSEHRRLAAGAVGHTEAKEHAEAVTHLVAAWQVERVPLAQAEIVKALRRLRVPETLRDSVDRVIAEASKSADLSVRNAAVAQPIPK